METAASLSLADKQRIITLNRILPDVRQLPSYDKLRLIRILAEELEAVRIFSRSNRAEHTLCRPSMTHSERGKY